MSVSKEPNLNSVTSINADGSRYFLHPADVRGFWTTTRKLVAWALIVIYLALPWINAGGHPLVFLDVETRNFHVFGFHFVTQDFWLMFFATTGLGFSLFLFTALLGRLWCGWACPYTVFLDHIFRRIERWIEGDSAARRRLAEAPWTLGKVTKRLVKHTLYALSAALIAHAFLAYFVSIPRLYSFMREGPLAHATAFGVVAFLTGVLWFCFGYFREQFCIIMCPYGRLQSALTDDETITIGYDETRGEPRGAAGKTSGDCVDCRRCVTVCPTGIDIRNGLQLECIACTACIDACDGIMARLDRPKGLIRYDSQAGFAGRGRRILRPRIIAYLALGLLGLVALSLVAWFKLSPLTVHVSRTGGTGYSIDSGAVRNTYLIRIQNKRNGPVALDIRLTADAPAGYRVAEDQQTLVVPGEGQVTRACAVVAPLESYQGPARITLELRSADGLVIRKDTRFMGPDPASVRPKAP